MEEKSSGTSIMKTQNTQWRCSTMQGHFIPPFLPSIVFSDPWSTGGDSSPGGTQSEEGGRIWSHCSIKLWTRLHLHNSYLFGGLNLLSNMLQRYFQNSSTAMNAFPGFCSEKRKATLVPLTIRPPLPCY